MGVECPQKTAEPTGGNNALLAPAPLHVANKVSGIVGTALPAVAGNLWIGAEWVSPQRRLRRIVAQIFGRQYSIWRDPLLHPLLERRDHVERISPGATAAMAHSRNHEQPIERSRIDMPATQAALDTFVVPDAGSGRDVRIIESVIVNELASAAVERQQIRVDGIQHRCESL